MKIDIKVYNFAKRITYAFRYLHTYCQLYLNGAKIIEMR